MPIVLDGSQGISTPMYAGSISSNAVTPVIGMKNKIINGACVIDQRNAGASKTITDTADVTYTLDRWFGYGTAASKFSVQQDAGAVTPPAGFTDYLGVTSLSAYSVSSSDSFSLGQSIEGFNIADLAWGTANAKTVTLSFWVRSSLIGTFGGSIRNSAVNRSYPFTYTISAANTWEQKSVTVAGDTSGTWLTTNGVGIRVGFGLGQGSTFSGTAGAWSGSNFNNATGATSVVGTNGATFYITGVQLEVGSTATSFDYRPYGTELALCQRYCQKFNDGSSYYPYAVGTWVSSTLANVMKPLLVTMRSTPSFTFTNSTNTNVNNGATQISATSITSDILSNDIVMYNINVASGGSAGYGVRHYQNAANSSNLLLSAEL